MTARPRPIDAVLWDIDGTLLDSEPWHFQALVAVCAAHGHAVAPEDQDRLLGHAISEVWALLDAARPMPLPAAAFALACAEQYIATIDAVPPRPGALEHIALVAGRGRIQACVSNAGRRIAEANLRRLDQKALGFAVSRDDVRRGKPHPEPYLLAARRLGVPAGRCLVVEDSPLGARAAKAAGMITIGWPQQPGLVFDAADRVVDSLIELDWDSLLA